MKSKKILGLLLVITLLSASVFGSINVFAASGDTHVALESYMPPVKTLFVDDDFQNRAVDENIMTVPTEKTTYDKPIKRGTGVTAAKTDTNIYASSPAWKCVEFYDKVISSSINSLVVSFKVNIESIEGAGYFYLRFGNTATAKAFHLQRDSSNGRLTISKFYGNASKNEIETVKNNISAVNSWIDIAVVLEKSGDNAILKKMFINGTDVDISGLSNPTFPADCNWWKATEASDEKLNTINVGNLSKGIVMVDDILVYEPQTVYFKDVTQTGLTIVNDSSSESVTGNLFLALYDTDGNILMANPYGSDVTVAAGESRTINAPTGSITDLTGVAKAKIFYWNGTTLAPICYAAEMSIS